MLSSVRQRNAIEMEFRWLADDGPISVVFRSALPSSTKKTAEFEPPLTKLSGSAHVQYKSYFHKSNHTYTTLTNFSTKYLVMCRVFTDVGGIK